MAPINSIYPVFVFEWQSTTPDMKLSFGHFCRLSTNDESNRYYHRFGEECLTTCGVSELTQQKFDSLREKSQIAANDPYFIIYVCVGAKLIIQEEVLAEHEIDGKHHRSLIQQGGIFIGQGQLFFGIPDVIKIDDAPVYHTSLDWAYFCNENLQPITKSKAKLNEISGYKQPVLFLGANDSDYNTIAWRLNIEIGTIRKGKGKGRHIRIYHLVPSFGARIVAIEKWDKGLQEISARIKYEILHDSVLKCDSNKTTFKYELPEFETIKKILFTEDRALTLKDGVIRTGVSQQDVLEYEPNPIQREFNICWPRENPELKKDFLTKGSVTEQESKTKQWSRLAVPPMYPLVHVEWEEPQHLCYLPSNEFQVNSLNDYPRYSIEKEDEVEGRKRRQWIKTQLNADNIYYIYDTGIQYEYHYTRLEREEDQNPFQHTGKTIQDTHYRLGVDGWMWKKEKDTPILINEQQTFRKIDANSGNRQGNSTSAQSKPNQKDRQNRRSDQNWGSGQGPSNRGQNQTRGEYDGKRWI